MANKIVVIGGVAAGPKAAARARRRDPEAEITVIERGEFLSYAGCGMPYYVAGLIEDMNELMSTPAGVVRDEAFFKNVKDIDVRSRTVAERIDREKKLVEILDLETQMRTTVPYDKLVIATGASATCPPIEGVDLNHVYRLNHPLDADDVKKAVDSGHVKNAVIIGGGLIGMEMTEALVARGVNVTVVEMMDQILPALLDFEVAAFVTKYVRSKGVEILTGTRVTKLCGDDAFNVTKVVTDKGEVEADLVLLSIGVRPNVKLAQEAGLDIGTTGAIKVDEYLRTSDPDIYAAGDCAEVRNLVTGLPAYVPLGSTANKHGRVVGDNVTGGETRFEGVLGTSVFKIFDFNVGRVGLTEKEARKQGIKTLMSISPGPDKAHYYPDHKPLYVKLLAEDGTGKILGAQIAGPGDAVKRIDVLASVMSFGAGVDALSSIDLGYAPPYSSAIDIVAHAANIIRNKIEGLAKSISPVEVKTKIDRGEDFVLLDVRSPKEFEQIRLDDPRVKLVPLGKLRSAAAGLPKDKEIVTFCKISLRGYEAQRILEGAGFENVKFMDGGLAGWPY